MTEYTLGDIQSLCKTMHGFMESVLGFDTGIRTRFTVTDESCIFDLDGDDLFQKKIDTYGRVGRLSIWEVDTDLDNLINMVWEKLNTHMRRDERELRFGLKQLGDALEGDQFNTEIGKMIAARMRVVRDDISAKYLPQYEKKVEEV